MTNWLTLNWSEFFLHITPWLVPALMGLVLLGVSPFFVRQHKLHWGLSVLAVGGALWLSWCNLVHATGSTFGGLWFDKTSYLFIALFSIITLLVLFLSHGYWKRLNIVRPEFYILILFALTGMGTMVAAANLMVFFLGLEIMSLSIYVLAGFNRSNHYSIEAALKYFLMGSFGSAFLLMGIAFLYGATGTTDLLALHEKAAVVLAGSNPLYFQIGLALLTVGFAFKVALVPFHMWVADVYEGAPVVVTAFMATAVKAAGFAALTRVVWSVLSSQPEVFAQIVQWGSIATMTVGNVAALKQRQLKRMLAYSSISHAGYLLIPYVAFSQIPSEVLSSVTFYLVAYSVTSIGLFAIIALLTQTDGEKAYVSDLNGLGQRKPFLAFLMTLFLLSLAGIPPTLGFFGKYYLILQAVHLGFYTLAVAAVLNSVISVYYYLTPIVAMYFGKAEEDSSVQPFCSKGISVVLILMALAVVGLGLLPGHVLQLIKSSVASWLVAGM